MTHTVIVMEGGGGREKSPRRSQCPFLRQQGRWLPPVIHDRCLLFLILFSSAIAAVQTMVFRAVQGVTHQELVRNCVGIPGSCKNLEVPRPSDDSWVPSAEVSRHDRTEMAKQPEPVSPLQARHTHPGLGFASKIKGKFLL